MALRCEECGAVPEDDAKGWRAVLCGDPDDPGDPEQVALYCLACARAHL